jgi:hypothetical protein
MVLFDTNSDWGFVCGMGAGGVNYDVTFGSAWSVRNKGFVTDGYGFGMRVLGNSRLEIKELYIDNNNLKISIRNNYSQSQTYNFTIDYEIR